MVIIGDVTPDSTMQYKGNNLHISLEIVDKQYASYHKKRDQ
jgi:hypothetical protein